MHKVNANDVVITTVTGCKKLLPLIVIGSSKTPKDFILDPFAATHPVP
jgi:hypothetical protein